MYWELAYSYVVAMAAILAKGFAMCPDCVKTLITFWSKYVLLMIY